MAMTLEQQRAIAMATARMRLGEEPEEQPEDEYRQSEAPFMAQVGRGMMDVYQGGKQLALEYGAKFGKGAAEERNKAISDRYNKQLEEELGLYNAQNPPIQAGRIAGNILTPLSLVPGAAGTGALARGASTVAAGGLFGATQPVEDDEEYWKSKAAQTAIGAALAPVAPLAIKGVGGISNFIGRQTRPFSDEGIARDIGGLIEKEAGDAQSVQKIRDAIINRQTHVPGNAPTAGQSIADAARGSGDDFGASIVKLEKELAREGVEGQPLRAQAAEQAARREGVIGAIAGTDADLAVAKAARKSRTDPLYKAVEESVEIVDTAPVLGKIDDILAKNPNETDITTPLASIRDKLTSGDNSPQALYSLSKEIKKMMGRITPGGQKEYNVNVLNEIKGVLDTKIGESERAFDIAQRAYKAKSAPINRMQVGRELQKGLVKSSDLSAPVESPAPFLGAVRDAPRTLKRGTGFNRYNELGDVLSPEQTTGVQNVANELLRKQQQDVMGRINPVISKMDTEISPRLPRLLERNIVIANSLLKRIGMDKSPEYHRIAVDMLQNPDKILPYLKLPEGDPKRRLAMEIMKNLPAQVPAQTGARISAQENQ